MSDKNFDVVRIPLELLKEDIIQQIKNITAADGVEFKKVYSNFGEGKTAYVTYEIEIFKEGNKDD